MKKLFTPGPVQLDPRVLESLAKPVISHRVEEFRRILGEAEEKLAKIYRANGYIALLTGSGTLAVESMIYSLLDPGERLLIISHGVFARRAAKTARSRGVLVDLVESPQLGAPVGVEELKRRIDNGGYDALLIVYNETSIGLAYRDLEQVARYAKNQGLLVLVDAVSALAGEYLETSSWRLDAVASASQKAIAAPPGLSFVALSDEALEKAGRTKHKPDYMDLVSYYNFYKRRRETPYTPSVNLVYALNKALDIILEKGLYQWIESHRRRATILYEKLGNIGFKPVVGDERYRSNTVTAFYTTTINVSASAIASRLYEKDIVIAMGIGENRDRIIRIGVMGNIGENDIVELVGEIEETVSLLRK